ncbi:MAG: electron transfer flavoprotein subunit alpha/FixB family protein [Nitrospira defluvii]|nr:electron transfer flavoprotein subunit alpha/FixB family protein [Nitrospira defluvii]
MNPILVFCEQRDGRLKKVGLEALGEACRLTKPLEREIIAVVIGSSVSALAQEPARHGASRVLVAEDPTLAYYSSEIYSTILTEVAIRLQPVAIVMGATAMGKDLAPKLAARLTSALIQDCVALEMDTDGSLLATRPMYGGKLHAVVKAKNPLMQIVTVRPNVFSPLEPQPASDILVERLTIAVNGTRPIARVRETHKTAGGRKELTEASIIVSGGRGLKGPEHFTLIEELAAALGAAVGASRAAVDAGWKPHSYQVGLTGKTVSPQLYIACGISGAIQHQAGMSSARTIVAINNNPNAPIFKLASYGIIGDLFEVVPLLTEEVKKLKTG